MMNSVKVSAKIEEMYKMIILREKIKMTKRKKKRKGKN